MAKSAKLGAGDSNGANQSRADDFKAFLRRANKDSLYANGSDYNDSVLGGEPSGGSSITDTGDVDDHREPLPLWNEDESLYDDEMIQVDKELSIPRYKHDALALHLRTLMDRCNAAARYRMLQRMTRIERAFQAVTTDGLECNDAAMLENTQQSNNHNDYLVLPLVYSKAIDLAVTMSNILFPPTGMYAAISRKDQEKAAKATAAIMNQHAQKFGHYTQSFRATLNLVKYNFCGVEVKWSQLRGKLVQPVAGGVRPEFKDGVIFEGNEVTSVDPYNLFWDTGVPNMSEHAHRGEFVAKVKAESLFSLRKRVLQEELYGSTNLGRDDSPLLYNTSYAGLYYHRPVYDPDFWERRSSCAPKHGRGHGEGSIDWGAYISGVADGSQSFGMGGLKHYGEAEVITAYVRLRPMDWGLKTQGAADVYGIWEIVLLNGKRIMLCKPALDAHGLLPIQVASLTQNETSIMQEKSMSELVLPFQEHAQDVLNKMQLTGKKGLMGGLTFYNAKYVKLEEKTNPISGYVAVNGMAGDDDIRKHIYQLAGLPDNSQAMNQIQELHTMVEQFMPTQQAQQVADLQRATEFQAAATVQASSKRHLALAKVADDELFFNVRMMQYYNLLQYSVQVEVLDDQSGQMIPVDLNAIATADIKFDISSGLLGMDRLIFSNRLYQIINMLIQGNLANQVDLLALIGYYTDVLGDRTDFNAFKIMSQFDALPPDQKQAAFQLFEQAQQASGSKAGAPAPQGSAPAPAPAPRTVGATQNV